MIKSLCNLTSWKSPWGFLHPKALVTTKGAPEMCLVLAIVSQSKKNSDMVWGPASRVLKVRGASGKFTVLFMWDLLF